MPPPHQLEYCAAVESILPGISALARDTLGRYLSLVDEYSSLLDLTNYRGAEELAVQYAYAPAQLALSWPLAPSGRAADLGSGGGCPVVALATLLPDWRFCAVESRERRSDFLKLVKSQLGLANLMVLNERSEALISRETAGFDLVTARAYAQPATLLAHAAALLKPGGELRAFAPADGFLPQLAGFEAPQMSDCELGSRHWLLLRMLRL